MQLKKVLLGAACIALLIPVAGCAVVSVATTAVAVAGTAVSVGISAGSAAVGATTAVAKGAVNVGSAVIGDEDDD